MYWFRAMAVWVVAGGLLAGCRPQPTNVSGVAPITNTAEASSRLVGYLDHAQPRLQTLKLWLGDQELVTELALKDTERNTGMMFRTNMLENEAMLFVFPQSQPVAFYMRNTQVRLSAAYIDPQGVIREIHDLHPFVETPVPSEAQDIQYVLETTQGWFTRHRIGVGTRLRTPRGSLAETFFNSR